MSSIFPATSVAILPGSRARAESNSAEKICVAAPGIASGAHGAGAACSQVGLAALNGSLELRSYFHLVLEPLLQPFTQLLGVFHWEPRDRGFNFCDGAHDGSLVLPAWLCKQAGSAIPSEARGLVELLEIGKGLPVGHVLPGG
jgi:hypothetical protein